MSVPAKPAEQSSSRFTQGDLVLQLRMMELDAAYEHIAKSHGTRLLEIGAGTGHQAAELARRGYQVDAIDLGDSPYLLAQVFPITKFDGRKIPFPDGVFDVVFSSNVLEHVDDLPALLNEIKRVLKPGGLSIHLMPTSAWRFWSLLSHFGWLVKRSVEVISGKDDIRTGELGRPRKRTTWRTALASLLPRRHGEHGTALGEIFTYRRQRWIRRIANDEMAYIRDEPAGVFYTNSLLLGRVFSLSMRRRVAAIVGSACRMYVFRRSASTRSSGLDR